MTGRFPGLVVQDWRTRLLLRHPALFPDARIVQSGAGPALKASGLPGVPEGWRAIVETLCRRLDEALAAESNGGHDAEIALLDLAEKWGTLRVVVSIRNLGETAKAAVTLAVDLAEARSAYICDACAAPGRLSQREGWHATRCEAHADGYHPIRERHPGVQVITTFVDGRAVRSARRYDFATDAFTHHQRADDNT